MTSDSSVLGSGFAFRWQADPLTSPPTRRPSIAPSRLPTRELGMTTTDPCPTARNGVCDVPVTCPQGDWSYHTGDGGGTRVDHALASSAVPIKDARYVYKTGRHILAGPANGRGAALSDHAVLSIRIPLAA
jgi:hypothetical protein